MRIVEATMKLHEEIGPRATTISAIAEKAGVQRLTVYRHFADEAAVFQACTSHWLSLHPLPEPAEWTQIQDPLSRMKAALASFYGYYSGTERMWRVAYRDVEAVPALQTPMTQVAAFLRSVGNSLVAAFPDQKSTALAATVHHALAFQTWVSLDDQGLDRDAMVNTVMRWIAAVTISR